MDTATPITPEQHESLWQEFEGWLSKFKSVLGIVTADADAIAPIAETVEAVAYPPAVPITAAAKAALDAGNAAVQANSVQAAVTGLTQAAAAVKAITAPVAK